MKFSHENLEIWQLGMKLVEVTYSLKNHFLDEDKFGLWDQIVRATEAIPRDIAEGYGKSSPKERALYMERAKSETAEVDTSYKLAIKKGRITTGEYEEIIKPLIQELYFKIIGYRKWLLKPTPPSTAINQLPQAQRLTNGFTLIEMLMVVFLFGLVMTLSGALFSAVLKGSGKSEVTKEVKQTGDYAMNVMERMIRNAKTVSCPAGDATTITITDQKELPTIFNCITPTGLTITSIASNSARLTGDNVTVGSPCTLVFTCDTSSSISKVTISFTLSQKEVSSRPEDQARVTFQQTIGLRTY